MVSAGLAGFFARNLTMGIFKFSRHPDYRASQTYQDHGDTAATDDFQDGVYDAISEVPEPGVSRKARRKKRLSPAAVIARSLAPDAQHMSPAEIIQRSLRNAYGSPTMTPTPPAPRHPPQFQAPPAPPPLPRPPLPRSPLPGFPFPIAPQFPVPNAPSRNRDQEPFADFWNVWMNHHEYLFKQSMRFTAGNMADAEDALSQAMLKGSQHFDGDVIRNERAWLTRLVHNACMDQHRSRKRQARLSDEIDGDDPDQAPNITPRPTRTPDEALHMRQTFDHLERQLMDLPVSLLEPLLLRVVEEKSYDEIAGRMGLSNCAVRKRIQLARDRLRQSKFL